MKTVVRTEPISKLLAVPVVLILLASQVVTVASRTPARVAALQAVADTCAEGGLPAHCRVRESDESNNISAAITVRLP
jgi:hypothetical protein